MIRTDHNSTVADIDDAKREYFTREPDRPSGRIRIRKRQPDALRKAKSRLRTAAWRADLDKKGRPETAAVCLQFMVSLVEVARESGHAVEDLPETKKAFDHLFDTMTARGFRRNEVEAVVKRLTRRAT